MVSNVFLVFFFPLTIIFLFIFCYQINCGLIVSMSNSSCVYSFILNFYLLYILLPCKSMTVKMSRFVGKPTMWFPNRSDTNRPVQLQKQARSLKFWS